MLGVGVFPDARARLSHGSEEAGAGVDALLARTSAPGTTSWYLDDMLGSVRDIASASGTVIDHIVYDAFGDIRSETSPSNGDRFKFDGMAWDAALASYYDNARYFSAADGKFVGQDPLSFRGGGNNLYAFVGNGPEGSTDPTGASSVGALPGYAAGGGAIAAGGAYIAAGVDYIAGSMASFAAGAAAVGSYAVPAAATGSVAVTGGAAVVALGGAWLYYTWQTYYETAIRGVDLSNQLEYLRTELDARAYYDTVLKGYRLYRRLQTAKDIYDGTMYKTEGVYEFPDQKNGGIPYVGQSGDVEGRLKRHESTGRYAPGTGSVTPVPGGKQARETYEHGTIQQITGGQKASTSPGVSNQRDPIGPNRRPGLGLPEPTD